MYKYNFDADYPFLSETMPKSWVEENYYGNEAKIKNSLFYENKKELGLNSPLVIANSYQHKNYQNFYKSLLKELDEFCKIFIKSQKTPGAKKMISPLWTSLWDIGNPQIFSVLSEVYVANYFKNNDQFHDIIRFEATIPGANRQADMLLVNKKTNQQCYLDIQFHKIKEEINCITSLNNMIINHAKNKYKEKEFKKMPSQYLWSIALVYIPSDIHISLFDQLDNKTNKENLHQLANVYLIRQGDAYSAKLFDANITINVGPDL